MNIVIKIYVCSFLSPTWMDLYCLSEKRGPTEKVWCVWYDPVIRPSPSPPPVASVCWCTLGLLGRWLRLQLPYSSSTILLCSTLSLDLLGEYLVRVCVRACVRACVHVCGEILLLWSVQGGGHQLPGHFLRVCRRDDLPTARGHI